MWQCPDCGHESLTGLVHWMGCRRVYAVPVPGQQWTYRAAIRQPDTGWQCPVCHHVYAPFVQGCAKCNAEDSRP